MINAAARIVLKCVSYCLITLKVINDLYSQTA